MATSTARGNLTEAGLVDWIGYVLETCIDQATFMTEQLDIPGMRERIAATLAFEEHSRRSGVPQQALMPLHYMFATGVELGQPSSRPLPAWASASPRT